MASVIHGHRVDGIGQDIANIAYPVVERLPSDLEATLNIIARVPDAEQ